MSDPEVHIPPGYGISLIPRSAWYSQGVADPLDCLLDRLLIWEPRRPGQLYVISADAADGLGLNRSAVDVLRVGNLQEPDEQVAQFVSIECDPIELASIVDAVGRFYRDDDGNEGLVAIECNGHGLATQAELQRHLGYSNFYVWQYEDKRDPRARYSSSIGWYTNRRTRPLILSRYLRALKATDPITGQPDYVVNSPFTMQELQNFETEGELWEARADVGATDDCVLAGAISVHVAQTLHFEDREPLSEQRRRMHEEHARRTAEEERSKVRRDYISQDFTAAEMGGQVDYDEEPEAYE